MIPVKNIYYMLAYVFQILNEDGFKNVAVEQFDNVAELCAAILRFPTVKEGACPGVYPRN